MLGIEEDLTTTDVKTEWKYSKHSRAVRINNPKKFKASLLKFQRKHPDIAIFADSISLKRQLLPWVGYMVAVVTATFKAIDWLA